MKILLGINLALLVGSIAMRLPISAAINVAAIAVCVLGIRREQV